MGIESGRCACGEPIASPKSPQCRPCRNEAMRQWRRDNQERNRLLLRESHERHREERLVQKKAWASDNPHKRRAHRAVTKALRNGELQRQACKHCGSPETQTHHPDYAQPLLVEWLCRSCHKKEHLRLKGAA